MMQPLLQFVALKLVSSLVKLYGPVIRISVVPEALDQISHAKLK